VNGCEDLIVRYWLSWQQGDWEAMRACLADAVKINDGHNTFTDADSFVAMAAAGPEWGDVDMVCAQFGTDEAAILYEGDNVSDGVRVRTAEFYRVVDDAIVEIEINWSVIGKVA
jgi:hypothetical protein